MVSLRRWFFTTFLTFQLETLQPFQKGEMWLAVLYLGSSLTFGFMAILLGRYVALLASR
ncbi:MAG: hypothetical protein ACRCYY_00130 [Trueperaceae bacterium]